MTSIETSKSKLLTVILPFGSAGRLTNELRLFGTSGYTTSQVDGFGHSGKKTYGLVDGANVRVEVIVDEALCKRILEHLDTHYAHANFVAHMHDVEAIPREHFRPRA